MIPHAAGICQWMWWFDFCCPAFWLTVVDLWNWPSSCCSEPIIHGQVNDVIVGSVMTELKHQVSAQRKHSPICPLKSWSCFFDIRLQQGSSAWERGQAVRFWFICGWRYYQQRPDIYIDKNRFSPHPQLHKSTHAEEIPQYFFTIGGNLSRQHKPYWI